MGHHFKATYQLTANGSFFQEKVFVYNQRDIIDAATVAVRMIRSASPNAINITVELPY